MTLEDVTEEIVRMKKHFDALLSTIWAKADNYERIGQNRAKIRVNAEDVYYEHR